MLSKTDLTDITKIVKSANDALRGEIRNEIKNQSTALRKEIGVEIKFQNEILRKEMNKMFDKLDRNMKYAINFLDRDHLNLLTRVETIDKHLGISPISV